MGVGLCIESCFLENKFNSRGYYTCVLCYGTDDVMMVNEEDGEEYEVQILRDPSRKQEFTYNKKRKCVTHIKDYNNSCIDLPYWFEGKHVRAFDFVLDSNYTKIDDTCKTQSPSTYQSIISSVGLSIRPSCTTYNIPGGNLSIDPSPVLSSILSVSPLSVSLLTQIRKPPSTPFTVPSGSGSSSSDLSSTLSILPSMRPSLVPSFVPEFYPSTSPLSNLSSAPSRKLSFTPSIVTSSNPSADPSFKYIVIYESILRQVDQRPNNTLNMHTHNFIME